MTTSSYQVGDVLLCHKHIGVAKFVGKLHQNDYQQLSSKSQNYIKPSDIWVGLQLAEEPNMSKLSLMKPHRKHSKSLKAIAYQNFNQIAYKDYFSAHYGLLIPYKYVHKKINPYQILSKLTQLFHTLKKTQRQNAKLTKKITKLQSEMNMTKKVKSTSQKSLESIIYDKNGNSYHHHQKITHTTTHSFKSSSHPSHFKNDNDNVIDHDDDESLDTKSTNTNSNNLTKQRNSKKLDKDEIGDDKNKDNDNNKKKQTIKNNENNDDNNNDNDNKTETKEDGDNDDIDNEDTDTMKCVSEDTNDCDSNSLSEKATDGVKDTLSERHISDDDEEEDTFQIAIAPSSSPSSASSGSSKHKSKSSRPALSNLLSHHTFNPESDIINEDNEEDYNIVEQHNEMTNSNIQTDANGNRLSHIRRYSAPYSIKKLSNQEFGSDYEKMYDPYWKNNGPRSLQFHHNLSPIQHGNNNANYTNNVDDNNTNPFVANIDNNNNDNNNNNNKCNNIEYKHGTHDSTELNMLPMIKEDPTTNRIYRASRVVHNQHNIRERHKRSASMSVVNMPRYFFDIDNEFPDLPDL